MNTHKGQRASSNVAYLEPALKRSNVHIEHHALTSRVLFDGLRATGVEVSQNGVKKTFHAGREVLLCAGAVDTPKLLQLSGIGPKELLARHGIPLRAWLRLSARTCRIISARATTIARICLR